MIRKVLLDQEGIDVHHQDHSGWTALPKAAHHSNLEVAKLLLDREDINIHLPDNRGRTALFWACDSGRLELVDLLLKKDGIDPNVRDVNSGHHPPMSVNIFQGWFLGLIASNFRV